jgi:hypothetical protein
MVRFSLPFCDLLREERYDWDTGFRENPVVLVPVIFEKSEDEKLLPGVRLL